MSDHDISFTNRSVWLTTTPTSVSSSLPFYALEAGHFFAKEDYFVKREYHDSFLILYSVKGAGQVSVNSSKAFTLSAGHFTVIDCHSPHSYCSISSEWEFFWLHFNGVAAQAYHELLYTTDVQSVDFSSSNKIYEFEKILTSFTSNGMLVQLDRSKQIEELLLSAIYSSMRTSSGSSCAKKISENVPHSEEISAYTIDEQMQKAVRYLEDNYASLRDLNSLCEFLHVSKYNFIRKFKRVMGIPPYSYLTNYRITCAKRMLVSTDQSIETIAGNCGFSDSANFISKFRLVTGQTPLQFRTGHRFII